MCECHSRKRARSNYSICIPKPDCLGVLVQDRGCIAIRCQPWHDWRQEGLQVLLWVDEEPQYFLEL